MVLPQRDLRRQPNIGYLCVDVATIATSPPLILMISWRKVKDIKKTEIQVHENHPDGPLPSEN